MREAMYRIVTEAFVRNGWARPTTTRSSTGDGLVALLRPADGVPRMYDARGPLGETLDVAFRPLDSPVTKRAPRRATAPVVLALSDEPHRSIVRHHHDGHTSAAT